MSKIEHAEVRIQVLKDSSERLVAEALIGQTAKSKEFLEALDREQLVEFVALMRMSLGQKESVKSEIKGYDAEKAKEKFLKIAQAAATAGTQSEMEKMMTLMMRQMEIAEKNKKEEREEAIKARARAEEIAEKNKKEE